MLYKANFNQLEGGEGERKRKKDNRVQRRKSKGLTKRGGGARKAREKGGRQRLAATRRTEKEDLQRPGQPRRRGVPDFNLTKEGSGPNHRLCVPPSPHLYWKNLGYVGGKDCVSDPTGKTVCRTPREHRLCVYCVGKVLAR